MRKIYQSAFLLFISSLVLFNASAQNIEWEKKVGGNSEWVSTPGIDQGKSVIALSDGSSLALINSSSAEGDFPTNSGKRDAWLFKLNASGVVIWKQRFGGAGDDIGNQVIATSDGGFIISGQTTSYPGPDINAWIIKTDASGNPVWNKSFGGSQIDVANSICQTTDGYVFTGYTKSNNGNLTGIKSTINEEDVWHVKLDLSGNIIWNKIFGGFWIDQGNSIIPVSDGSGFAIAGFTQSNDRDVAGLLKGWRSGLVIKIDNAGTVVWKKTFGGNEDTRAYSIINIAGGGFAFAGTTNSTTGAIFNTKGFYDYLLVKLDAAGNTITSRTYGGSNSDFAYGLAATSDGGFALMGRSDSPSGGTSDLTTGTLSYDSWVIKVDAGGTKVWDKNYRFNDTDYGRDNGAGITTTASGELLVIGSIAPGLNYYDWAGAKDENPFVVKYAANGTQVWASNFGVQRKFTGFDKGISVKQAPDGSYYFLAATESNDGDVNGLGAKAARDILIQKWSAGRNTVWQTIIGGLKFDDPKDMKVTPDGGVIIAATSYSTDGDLVGTIGNTQWSDLWLIKLSASGVIEWKKNYGGHGDDVAHSIEVAPGGGYVVATHSWSGVSGDITVGNGLSNAWVIKVDGAGNIVWEKSFGGALEDEANKIIATSDGGYAISGWTKSTTGDFSVNKGGFDAFVIKFDANGVKQWSKTYGGTSEDYGDAIAQAPDGSLYIAGRTNSTNGDIAALATGLTYEWNAFVMKLSITDGAITWSKSIGGAYYDELRDMISSPSGDPMLVLFADGGNGDFSENKGFHDSWIVKMNGADGAIKWKKNYGGSLNDDPVSISRANNGGYLVAGVGNFDNMWDQLDFTNNGEAFAIKISDNEVQSASITTSGPTTLCQGGSVTLTAVSTGAVSFQWYKNGTLISGANSTTYVANTTGTYSMNATNASGGIATASVDVVVNPAPTFPGPYNAGDIKQSITFGGYGNDNLTTLRQGLVATTDGGYIFTGQTNTNNDGDLAGLPYYGGVDVVVVKLDCGVRVQWKKTFGGSGADQGYAVIQTADGGYMIAATTSSPISGDISATKGGQDAWLLKLDANGDKQWQKNYGGTNADVVNSVVQTPEGDYIFVGNTLSIDGDLTGFPSKGGQDIWIVKINALGSIVAQKRTGGAQFEDAYYVNRTSDGNYMLTGVTASNDGDITGAKGGQDGYVEKFSTDLSKIWSRNYGGFNSDQLTMFKNTTDGNYILSGLSVTGEANIVANGAFDYWALKLTPEGSALWEKLFGSPSTDQGQSIETTGDGGYVLSGVTLSNGEYVTGFKGIQDAWVTRLDSRGNLIWQKTYGGSNVENGTSIIKNNSGEFVVLSRAISTDGDLSGLNKGGADLWLTRIADCSSFTTGTITPASHAALIYETTFLLTANAGTGYTYQWYRDNRIIAGANQQTYSATQTGLYKVQVTAPGSCSGYSNELSLVFNNKLYVNDNNTSGDIYTSAIGSNANTGLPTAPFATLQYAVSQAKIGDTVYVDAGTYAEQVIIDKGITISGAGQNLTSIVTPSATLVPAPGPFSEIGLIETTQSIGDVHISDLSVTSSSTNPSQNIIIQSGGSVKNCKLVNGNQGIFFRVEAAVKTALIENNEIQPNGIGVNCQGAGLTARIVNNTISNVSGFYAGVFAGLDFGPLVQLTATGNSINNYFGSGFLANSFNSTVTQNSIVGTGNYAFERFSGNTPNVTCNWFGTTDAELIKARINGVVNYAPWLTSGVDTSAAPGFQAQLNICNGRQNKFYVNDNSQIGDVFTTAVGNNANNGFRAAPFATIRYALGIAQPGDTIYVDAGSYVQDSTSFTINKSVTILGSNYNVSPNSSADRLIINTNRNAESFISGATIFIGANNVILNGFTISPGSRNGIALSNAASGSFTFAKNKVVLTSFVAVSLTGTIASNAAALTSSNYTISDNRFEKTGDGTAQALTLSYIKNVQVSNNAFVRIGTSTRSLLAVYAGQGGIVDNFTLDNNVSEGVNHNLFTYALAKATISGNVFKNYNNGLFIQTVISGKTDITVSNNTFQTDTVSANHLVARSFDGATADSTKITITGNTLSLTAISSMTVMPIAISTQFPVTAGNPILEVSGNQIDFEGNFSRIKVSQIGGISLNGNNKNVTVENNRISFSGTEPDTSYLTFKASGIYLTHDGMNTLPAGGSILIQNNLITGFKNSISFYDFTSSATNSYTGYGRLPAGVNVNITNNSFTNDSLSINNGDISQTVIANCNWFGSSAAQNVNPKVTETTVNHSPWLTNGTDNDIAIGFQPVSGACNGVGIDADVITAKNVTCKDAADGSIDILMEEGVAPFIFEWSKDNVAGFATTEDLTDLGPGVYHLKVTDANGSVDETITVTITEPAVFGVSSSSTNITCFGAGNGSATVTATGGTLPYTYLWSNESTTNAINHLGDGTYSVTVTDANGCTTNAEIIITEPEELLVSNDGLDVSCNGTEDGFISLSVSGGTGEYAFLWSNGATGSALYDLGAGTYSVTVTDANGCSVEGNYTISEPAILEAAATGTNVTSSGASDGTITLTLTGGTEPYDVLWSNEATGTELSGLSAGIYTAIITDYNGCTATASYEVQGPSITINVSGTNVNCFNGSDGTATATPLTGTAPFTYEWSNGETTQTISGLTPGTYSVTVTDADNSSATGEFIVSEPLSAVTASLSATPVLCFGGNTGSVTATGNGGTGSYTYLWSNGSTNNAVNNLTAGIYTVTVTDANGCAASENIEVTQPTQLVPSASGTNATCNGGNDGSATVSATGGTEPYTYLWSNGITTYNNPGLPVGTYTVTVTDGNGCTANASYTVTQPSPVNASITSNNITCFGANNGSISINARGGTAPYLYRFNNGAYGSTFSWTDLVPGAYTVVAKDANNCLFSSTITITEPQILAVVADATTNTCVGSNNGTIAITVSGGTTRYGFSWTGPNGFTAVKEDLTGLAAGDYTVTITDANGCVVAKTITIAELAAPSVTETIIPVTCFGTSTGSIILAVSAGTFTYSWAGPGGYKATTKDIANLKAGTYTVTITPAGGCIKTAAYTVTQPIVLAATTVKTDITVCGGTGSITVTATGGNASYQYSKGGNIFQSENSFTGLTAGNYTITVKDNKGCTVTATVSIVDNGADPYEANERQTNAQAITVNAAVITARIAPTANDKDWYRFTTNAQGTYTLAVTHPTVLYSYDIYDSRGRVITPATTSTSSKSYTLLANTLYAVQVRGALSYVCYQMQVSGPAITGAVAPRTTNTNEVNSNETVSFEGKLNVSLEELKATVFPNPHQGNFNLKVVTNKDYEGVVQLVNVAGQIIETRNVKLKKGIDNMVRFTGRHEAILFYQVKAGNKLITDKVIGPN